MLDHLAVHGAGEQAAWHSVQQWVVVAFLFDLGHIVYPSLQQLALFRGREAVLQGYLYNRLRGRWQCCLPMTWLLHKRGESVPQCGGEQLVWGQGWDQQVLGLE
jgi:hypothetical protein